MSASPSPAAGLSKMAIMIPVMLYARTLDSEDPQTKQILRIVYGVTQSLSLLLIVLSLQVCKKWCSSNPKSQDIIYIPGTKGMFDDPNAPKKYSKSTKAIAYSNKLNEAFNSAGMSLLMTCGLHYYKGMVMGLLIQSVMGPFGLFENKLLLGFIKLAFGIPFNDEERFLEEKLLSEVTPKELATIDAEGKITIASRDSNPTNSTTSTTTTTTTTTNKTTPPPIEDTISSSPSSLVSSSKKSKPFTKSEQIDFLLDLWDAGSTADLSLNNLVNLTSSNVNLQLQEDENKGWTALMIISGLNTPNTIGALKYLKSIGADPSLFDKDGWSALHWSAFHKVPQATQFLLNQTEGFNASYMITVKDREGKDVRKLCIEEGNDDVLNVVDNFLDNINNNTNANSNSNSNSNSKNSDKNKEDTIRLRKKI